MMVVLLLFLAGVDQVPTLPDHATEAPKLALSFDQAVGQAASAPAVLAARKAAVASRDLADQISSLTHNPQLALQPGLRLRPDDAREPELLAEIVMPWNLSGHGRARRQSAALEGAALQAAERAALLDRRLGVARAWIDLWAGERTLEELRSGTQLAAELERLVERAAALEAATRADVAEARAFHSEARLDLLAAEGALFEAGLALARQLGLARPAPVGTVGELPAPTLPNERAIVASGERLDRLPSARLARLRARAASARTVEEGAARGTTLSLGAGIQRDAPGGLVLSAIARVSPSLFDRGERERSVAAAGAAALEGEAEASLREARAELIVSQHESHHTAAQVAELQDRLVPAARQAAELRRRIYQEGDATLVEVLRAQRAALSASSRLLRARADRAWADVKLWLLLSELALPEAPSRGGRGAP